MENRNEMEHHLRKKKKQQKYRLVWYYNQWPIGDDYKVVADGLTFAEAKKLQNEKSLDLSTERFEIEPSE
ncbi:MAG: hypothetical protein ACXVCP_15280 [Bdellovibrio sp.]